jgi:hypothetical protein
MLVSANNKMLMERTIPINDVHNDVRGMATLLNQQAAVLTEQTRVFQKLSVWLDMQIRKER